ncbi:MAG: putative ABC transporter ATP-binding protein [Candidatus Heimdallarchaeota archaeon LC_3]|nr:MAG: putative ABC transporter ATP-binding protein [Candidatus Heimdallarchaeota archaeon LC_3]
MVIDIINADKITHIYSRPVIKEIEAERRITALNDITVKISTEGLYVFMGPSGSGKTTLFNILSTFLVPTTGSIKVNNEEVYSLKDQSLQILRLKKLAYLFQKVGLNFIPQLTVQENILIVLEKKKKLKKPRNKNNITEFLQSLHLKEHCLNLKAELLSIGEQQRLGLLLALLKDPEILFLDEPTSHLDAESKIPVLQSILQEVQKRKTILVSTHDPTFIPFAKEIFILQNGKFITTNSLQFIADSSKSHYKFPGEEPNQQYQLEIPHLIFNQLEAKSVYVVKQESTLDNSITLLFSKLDNKDFESSSKENWIFLKEKKFQIPKEFINLPWFQSTIDWMVTSKTIKLKLVRKKDV